MRRPDGDATGRVAVGDSTLRCYRAYGMDIRSPLVLPQLGPGKGGEDIAVRFGSVGQPPTEPISAEGWADGTIERCRLMWPHVGTYLVSAGREIVMDPAPGVSATMLSLLLTGPVLAAVLVQRGFMVLHASAVEVDGQTVLFAGHSGMGKSTIAGAMLARGHRLVVDDVSAIDLSGAVPTVLPGFPHQKLWPDSAQILGLNEEALPLVLEGVAKRSRPLPHPVPETPLPLRRLYLLEEGETITIEPVTGLQAFVRVAAFSYVSRLLGVIGQDELHFQQCSALVSCADLRRLVRPRRWKCLPAVIDAVEADLRD